MTKTQRQVTTLAGLVAVLALMAPMMQQLMGYPVMLTGLVAAPRGLHP